MPVQWPVSHLYGPIQAQCLITYYVSERVTGRKPRGLQTEEIGYKCQTIFSLSLKWQEETNYKC